MAAPRLVTSGLCSTRVGTPSRTYTASEIRMSASSNRTCSHPTARTWSRWMMPFGELCRSACTMVESLRTWNNWNWRSCWSVAHSHGGSIMALSTSEGVACRLSVVQENGNKFN